jgi:hypothetical protein
MHPLTAFTPGIPLLEFNIALAPNHSVEFNIRQLPDTLDQAWIALTG